MNAKSLKTLLSNSMDAFCEARDVHRSTAWERLSVAYPDPREALRALEIFSTTRLSIAAGAA